MVTLQNYVIVSYAYVSKHLFHIEGFNGGNLPVESCALVISSQEKEVFRVLDFVG
jgi:hypothetical protein